MYNGTCVTVIVRSLTLLNLYLRFVTIRLDFGTKCRCILLRYDTLEILTHLYKCCMYVCLCGYTLCTVRNLYFMFDIIINFYNVKQLINTFINHKHNSKLFGCNVCNSTKRKF